MDDTIDLLQIKINKARAELPEETRNAIDAVDWRAVILRMKETKRYNFEQLGDLELETELLLCGLVSPEDYPREIQNRMHISKQEAGELVKEMNNLVFSKIKEELIKNIGRVPPSLDKGRTEEGSLILDPHPTSPLSRGRGNTPDAEEKTNTQVLNSAGIKIILDLPAAPSTQIMQVEKLELNSPPLLDKEGAGGGNSKENHPAFGAPPQKGGEGTSTILAQKLSNPVKNEVVKTEYFLNNLSKTNSQNESPIPQAPKAAPISYPPGGDPYRLSPD